MPKPALPLTEAELWIVLDAIDVQLEQLEPTDEEEAAEEPGLSLRLDLAALSDRIKEHLGAVL